MPKWPIGWKDQKINKVYPLRCYSGWAWVNSFVLLLMFGLIKYKILSSSLTNFQHSPHALKNRKTFPNLISKDGQICSSDFVAFWEDLIYSFHHTSLYQLASNTIAWPKKFLEANTFSLFLHSNNLPFFVFFLNCISRKDVASKSDFKYL